MIEAAQVPEVPMQIHNPITHLNPSCHPNCPLFALPVRGKAAPHSAEIIHKSNPEMPARKSVVQGIFILQLA